MATTLDAAPVAPAQTPPEPECVPTPLSAPATPELLPTQPLETPPIDLTESTESTESIDFAAVDGVFDLVDGLVACTNEWPADVRGDAIVADWMGALNRLTRATEALHRRFEAESRKRVRRE